MIKKIAPILLLFIFIFNIAGYYFAFKAVQLAIKHNVHSEIKSGVFTKKLSVITVNKSDLSSINWIEYGKEMIYNKKIYDIVKSDETAETITYDCMNDADEELLFEELEEHINRHLIGHKPNKNTPSQFVVDNVNKLYFNSTFLLSSFQAQLSIEYQISLNLYPPALIEVNPPPPKFS